MKDCFEKFAEVQKAELNNDVTHVLIGLVDKTNWVNNHDFSRLYMKVYDKVFFLQEKVLIILMLSLNSLIMQ